MKMPWKETNVMDQKKEFVLEALKGNMNFTSLCAKYCISPKTGYKWKQRFLERGFEGLEELSRKPESHPEKLSEDEILAIIKIKNQKKNWGAKKIREIYANKYPKRRLPSISTFNRLFQKTGLAKKRRKKRKCEGVRLENRVNADHPNHVWTVDFKGWWYTPNRERVNPLTVRDDFSKNILAIKTLDKGDTASVYREFDQLFREYGLPEVIRSDNGPPFANMRSLFGLTRLSVWWLSQGIRLDRIEPGAPYQNGAHERMHLDMANELEGQIYGDIRYHQKMFERWRREYNEERPHEALDMKTPDSVYQRSEREYDGEFVEFEYPINFRKRFVNNRGFIGFQGKRYFVGNPFGGYNIGINITKTGQFDVWFGDSLLGHFDKESLLLIPEKTYTLIQRKKRKVLPMF
jgi:putative transposase